MLRHSKDQLIIFYILTTGSRCCSWLFVRKKSRTAVSNRKIKFPCNKMENIMPLFVLLAWLLVGPKTDWLKVLFFFPFQFLWEHESNHRTQIHSQWGRCSESESEDLRNRWNAVSNKWNHLSVRLNKHEMQAEQRFSESSTFTWNSQDEWRVVLLSNINYSLTLAITGD